MTNKIQDLIKKIHRDYLPELLNGEFYTMDKQDSLPNLDSQIANELAQSGINIRYKRDAIFFIKLTFPNK